jgi:hypothetical protein
MENRKPINEEDSARRYDALADDLRMKLEETEQRVAKALDLLVQRTRDEVTAELTAAEALRRAEESSQQEVARAKFLGEALRRADEAGQQARERVQRLDPDTVTVHLHLRNRTMPSPAGRRQPDDDDQVPGLTGWRDLPLAERTAFNTLAAAVRRRKKR